MAIILKKVASCDNPKCDSAESTSSLTLSSFRSNLREKGWSVGRKYIYCPKCANGPVRKLGRYSSNQAAKPVIPTNADVGKILCNTWGNFTICFSAECENNEISDFILPRYMDGDILYVREGWAPATVEDIRYEDGVKQFSETYTGIIYRADQEGFFPDRPADRDEELWISTVGPYKWKSARTMPRNAVRLFLKVKNTRFAKVHNGKFYFQETNRSATEFDWNDLPWKEVITVERCDRPINFK